MTTHTEPTDSSDLTAQLAEHPVHAPMDAALLRHLGRLHGDDAVQDVLTDLAARGRVIGAVDGSDRTLMVDHLANNVEHAVARLRLAVRQRAIRRATRAAADGERLRRFHQDESATALDAATVATEHDPAWLAPLRTALGALDDVVRTALVRHHLYDESYDELAQLFQLPAATLRQRCHRARRQLADALQPYADAA